MHNLLQPVGWSRQQFVGPALQVYGMAMPLPTIRLCKTETFFGVLDGWLLTGGGRLWEEVAHGDSTVQGILWNISHTIKLQWSIFSLDTILVVCSYMHAVPTFYQVAICFKEGKKQYSLYDVTYLHVEVKLWWLPCKFVPLYKAVICGGGK